MRLKALAFAAAVTVGAAFAPQLATAAALPSGAGQAIQSHATESSAVQEVRRRGRHWRHRHWRHRRHFYRPPVYSRCSRVRRSCAYRFGWGTRSHYRCVRSRGC